jgi:tartrate-resistant acid phosphatase type 5
MVIIDNFDIDNKHAVLGNHDYRGDALAQLSPVLRKVDSRWICIKSFVVSAGE